MSHIVFDTSVLFPDFRLGGAILRSVLQSAEKIGDRVYVPEVVLDELVNKYRDSICVEIAAFNKASDRLGRLVNASATRCLVDAELETSKYREWLLAHFKAKSVSLISYPYIGHRELAERALQRRKPFDEKGQRGYRDALIWESVRSQSRTHKTEVLFVSGNAKDFAAEGNPQVLHPDLTADLPLSTERRGSVRLFNSLTDLLSLALAPRENIVPELEEDVAQGRLGQLQIQAWLQDNLSSLLDPVPISWMSGFVRRKTSSWRIGRPSTGVNVFLSSTSSLTDRSFLAVLGVSFEAEFARKQRVFDFEPNSGLRSGVTYRFHALLGAELDSRTHDIVSIAGEHVFCTDEDALLARLRTLVDT